jgi:hypothetical protein
MTLTPEAMIAGGSLVVAAVVWLVRLEGRVNSAKSETDALKVDLVGVKAKAEAEAAAHSETTIALVRVQEQLKYLTDLFERHFVTVQPPARTRRSPPK